MNLVYYEPRAIIDLARELHLTELSQFCEVYKLFNRNACYIDRTLTFNAPTIRTAVIYPIPTLDLPVASFEDCVMARAAELAEHPRVTLFYSGGLDSTCVLLALLEAIDGRTRLKIATTPDAQRENPKLWNEVILKLPIELASTALQNRDRDTVYVTAELADQLFGSDRALSDFEVVSKQPIGDLPAFVRSKVASTADRFITERLYEVAKHSPVELRTVLDLLWWVNFTGKWQAVALRADAFAGSQQRPLVPFFNTYQFQRLAMSDQLDRWSNEPSLLTYKQDERKFIAKRFNWPELNQKQKVGSLYNVVRHRETTAGIYISDGAFRFLDRTGLRQHLEENSNAK